MSANWASLGPLPVSLAALDLLRRSISLILFKLRSFFLCTCVLLRRRYVVCMNTQKKRVILDELEIQIAEILEKFWERLAVKEKSTIVDSTGNSHGDRANALASLWSFPVL